MFVAIISLTFDKNPLHSISFRSTWTLSISITCIAIGLVYSAGVISSSSLLFIALLTLSVNTKELKAVFVARQVDPAR